MSSYTGTPKQQRRETSIDLISELIDLHRLPAETLPDFKLRVLDAYIRPADSTYVGTVNAVNRETGLVSLETDIQGILVDVLRDVDGHPINPTAGLYNDGKTLTLYSDQGAGTVESTLNLQARSGAYFAKDVVAGINASGSFSATQLEGDSYDKSSHFVAISSMKLEKVQALREGAQLHHLTALESGNFVVGDLVFPESMDLTTEVLTLPDDDGEFMVDYNNGVFWTSKPLGGRVTYWYQAFPLFIRWSPISVFRFKDSQFLDLVTEQIQDADGQTVDGIPTVEGADLVNELLAVAPMNWGE